MPPAKHLEALHDSMDVESFSDQMVAKLNVSRDRGRHGWRGCSTDKLWEELRQHVEERDPVDIANLAMMIHHNSKRIVQS